MSEEEPTYRELVTALNPVAYLPLDNPDSDERPDGAALVRGMREDRINRILGEEQ